MSQIAKLLGEALLKAEECVEAIRKGIGNFDVLNYGVLEQMQKDMLYYINHLNYYKFPGGETVVHYLTEVLGFIGDMLFNRL